MWESPPAGRPPSSHHPKRVISTGGGALGRRSGETPVFRSRCVAPAIHIFIRTNRPNPTSPDRPKTPVSLPPQRTSSRPEAAHLPPQRRDPCISFSRLPRSTRRPALTPRTSSTSVQQSPRKPLPPALGRLDLLTIQLAQLHKQLSVLNTLLRLRHELFQDLRQSLSYPASGETSTVMRRSRSLHQLLRPRPSAAALSSTAALTYRPATRGLSIPAPFCSPPPKAKREGHPLPGFLPFPRCVSFFTYIYRIAV